ncbi:hypothetical protein [Rhizobium sp. BK251]|uniref:hypothetical protein n=1 Tax=Rhizobium sp. BK251 TaxID=2512125 RepID=UPI00104C6CBB|nr:hypothetical protein [Rhizobium sp. BK251]TCL69676.1 hypothetical protein EV286_108249 [Rhizobium sp. BK251]
MGKAATRGRSRRKSSGKSRARSGGNLLSWAAIGVMAIGGIALYDNWKSVAPMLSRHASSSSTGEVAAAKAREPAPKQVSARQAPPKQVALASPPPRPATTTASVPKPSVAIPSVPVPAAQPAAMRPAAPVAVTGGEQTASAAFGFCGQGKHVNCVEDGNTFWYKGEMIRISDVSSPGVAAPRCEDERRVGLAAKVRLLKLLNAGPFVIKASGSSEGGDGGKTRLVLRNGRSLGAQLANEGLARKPDGPAWCA